MSRGADGKASVASRKGYTMKDLTRGNIYKTFFSFALPLVFSGVLSQMYAIVDTVIAGQYLGEAGLAAIGATSSYITFISSFVWGYGTGVGIFIGHLFGAKEYGRIKNNAWTQILLIVLAALLLGGGSVALHRPIFTLLRVDAAVWDEAFRYFAIYMGGFFCVVLNNCCMHIATALGSSTVPFVLSVVSGVLNVAGNIFSVVVLHWGAFGLGLSTVFASAVTFAIYLIYFAVSFRKMPTTEKTRLTFGETKWIFTFSLPTSFQQATMYAASLLLSPMVNAIGPAATASYSVTHRIFEFNSAMFYNSSRTVGSYTAQCMGAEKYEKIKKGIGVGLLQALAFLLPVMALCLIFPDTLVGIFSKAGDGESLGYSLFFVKVCLPFAVFHCVDNLFHHLYRGVKKMGLLLLSTGFASLVRIAVGFILTPFFGMEGFYVAWAASWVLEALLNLLVYLFGLWIPKEGRNVIRAPLGKRPTA